MSKRKSCDIFRTIVLCVADRILTTKTKLDFVNVQEYSLKKQQPGGSLNDRNEPEATMKVHASSKARYRHPRELSARVGFGEKYRREEVKASSSSSSSPSAKEANPHGSYREHALKLQRFVFSCRSKSTR